MGPAGQLQIALGRQPPEVAGGEPARRRPPPRPWPPVDELGHAAATARSPGPSSPRMAAAERSRTRPTSPSATGAPVVVDDGELDAGYRPAHRGRHLLVARRERGARPERGLRRGVAHHDRHAEASPHLGHHGRGHAGCTGGGDAQGAQIGAVELGAGQHECVLSGHALGHGDPLVRHDAQRLVGLPGGGRDDRGHAMGDLVPRPRHVARHGRRAPGRGADHRAGR